MENSNNMPWEVSGAEFKPTKIGGISPCEGDAHIEIPCPLPEKKEP